ncbi:hypothetical protein QGN29_05330 [Temperatibacter marinus]|uniref:Sulfotransferase domain-containing protein n=1 Tax=Temperatibacter marinus TaxID=1456591 RepID=A0AA52EFK0_9PROT|nr:hypothetical protein [Temperatibacter marinus]WND03795.1 hypothetical protein QGN29_05330 [Temperatibacter marinus]
MRKKIILHCGAPKTATTSLQSIFNSMEDDFRKSGIHYLQRYPFKGEKYAVHEAFVHAKNGKVAAAVRKAQDCVKEEFKRTGAHTIIISNESLLHDPLIEGVSQLYPKAEGLFPILKEMFEGYELIICFVIRNQADHLPSYYTQRVRQGLSLSLSDYCGQFDLDKIRWAPFLNSLMAFFGAENIRINTFQDYVQNPETTIKILYPELSNFHLKNEKRHANSSPSHLALTVMRHYNKVMDFLFSRSQETRHKIQRHLREKQFPVIERLYPGSKAQLDPKSKEKLHSLYHQDLNDLGLS